MGRVHGLQGPMHVCQTASGHFISVGRLTGSAPAGSLSFNNKPMTDTPFGQDLPLTKITPNPAFASYLCRWVDRQCPLWVCPIRQQLDWRRSLWICSFWVCPLWQQRTRQRPLWFQSSWGQLCLWLNSQIRAGLCLPCFWLLRHHSCGQCAHSCGQRWDAGIIR